MILVNDPSFVVVSIAPLRPSCGLSIFLSSLPRLISSSKLLRLTDTFKEVGGSLGGALDEEASEIFLLF